MSTAKYQSVDMGGHCPATTQTPSLGRLGRLPGELRNAVYELVVTTEHDLETSYHKSCRQRQSLHLVSKQINAETKSLLSKARGRTCKHQNIAITIPTLLEMPPRDYHCQMLDSIIARDVVHQPHNISNARTIRFITGHLGKDVPLAVVVHFNLPTGSTFSIHGAGAARYEKVSKELKRVLGCTERRAGTPGFDYGVRGIVSTGDSLHPFDITCVAERVRDVVCIAVDKELADLEY